MGKGDRKSRRGKIFNKSFGKSRPKKRFTWKQLHQNKGNSYCRKTFSKNPSFKGTHLNDPITEFALALTATRDGHYYASGTAIIIAPNLALTAKHVIEDYMEKFETVSVIPKTGHYEGKFSIQAIQILGERKSGAIWNITKFWYCNGTDLCFIRLTPASELAQTYKWRLAKMNFSKPDIGGRITAFGYADAKIDNTDEKLNWSISPSITVGEIIEVHEQRRDNTRLNFPCFMVNARFDGGMSGGPVFNEDGHLCGIICSNLPPSNIHESHVSYATLLWPCLGTHIDLPYQGLEHLENYPALVLAQMDIIKGENFDNIFIQGGKLIYKTNANKA